MYLKGVVVAYVFSGAKRHDLVSPTTFKLPLTLIIDYSCASKFGGRGEEEGMYTIVCIRSI